MPRPLEGCGSSQFPDNQAENFFGEFAAFGTGSGELASMNLAFVEAPERGGWGMKVLRALRHYGIPKSERSQSAYRLASVETSRGNS
jgi:hypothetical protein